MTPAGEVFWVDILLAFLKQVFLFQYFLFTL